jgi:hypothetical protein
MLRFTKTMGKDGRYLGRGASKAAARKRLLQQMIETEKSEDQSKIDEALVEANRWLRQYGFDWDILDGVARLRGANPPSDVTLKEGLERSRRS